MKLLSKQEEERSVVWSTGRTDWGGVGARSRAVLWDVLERSLKELRRGPRAFTGKAEPRGAEHLGSGRPAGRAGSW